MDFVTAADCKQVVKVTGIRWLGHHRCIICGVMVGYRFGTGGGGDGMVVFDPSCGCRAAKVRPRSWEQFAEEFNIQTPAERGEMWERFKAGKPTHEID